MRAQTVCARQSSLESVRWGPGAENAEEHKNTTSVLRALGFLEKKAS